MKEPKFDSKINDIYNSLSDKQKAEYKNEQEHVSKNFLIFSIVLTLIIVAVLVLCIVMCISGKMYTLLIFAIVIIAISGAMIGWTISTALMGLKGSDEVKTKMYIKRLENKKIAQKKDLANGTFLSNFPVENIKNVTILDSYTEWSDKLHAIMNYQEIIQTRIYKFKVDYYDGTSQIITAAENSKQYSTLISLVNKNQSMQINTIPTTPQKSNIEKIREYKQLLDDGIITQEEFETKKKELL